MSNNSPEHLLNVRARSAYANFSMTMVEIGIHLFMALYGLSVFLESSKSQRKGRKRYIAASFVITVLRALSGSLDIGNYFQVLFKSTSPSHWGELLLNFREDWKYFLGNTSLGLVPMIGDALLMYRCYIVCVEYWWVTILPMITSLSALVLFFIATSLDVSDPDVMKYGSASTFLTVSTNIVVTSFITFRLLRARRTLAKVLPSANVQVYTGVIAILIESAAPLTIFGIIAAILQQLRGSQFHLSPGFYVCRQLFDGLFYSFCALSPHMIIFRVTTGRSFTKLPTPKDDHDFVSHPIQFARQTAECSFLQSTLNHEFERNRDLDAERGQNKSVGVPTQTRMSIIHLGQEKWSDAEDAKNTE